MAYEKLELLINGKFTTGTSGKTEAVINPATEEVLGHLPLASTADLDEVPAIAIMSPNRIFTMSPRYGVLNDETFVERL